MNQEELLIPLFTALFGGTFASFLTYKFNNYHKRNDNIKNKINQLNSTNAACIHAINEIINFKMNLFRKIFDQYNNDREYFTKIVQEQKIQIEIS